MQLWVTPGADIRPKRSEDTAFTVALLHLAKRLYCALLCFS